MKHELRPSVAVITPSIGRKELRECAQSISSQTYSNVIHYVVVDGSEHEAKVKSALGPLIQGVRVAVLPENTGRNGFNGHRIYGAFPYLVNTDFVMFLDEDNWVDDSHVEKLVNLVIAHRLDWAYSLRKIMDMSGSFICYDDCDSLGIWGQWYGEQNHIDANCYLLKRELAIESSKIWNRKGYSNEVLDPDKALCRWLISNCIRGFTSGLYTLNYRLGSTDETVSREYFVDGNRVMERRYRHFPWRQARLDHIDDKTALRRILTKDELDSGVPLKWAILNGVSDACREDAQTAS